MWPQLKCSKVLYSKHENVCRILGTSYNRTILGFHVALSLIPKLFCDIENCIENADFQKMMEDVYNASTDESDMTDSEGDEGEDLVLDRLAISKEQANKNYDLLGSPVTPDPSTLVLDELRIRHPAAFDKEVERLLASVVEEAGLPFPLTDFQVAHYPVDLFC